MTQADAAYNRLGFTYAPCAIRTVSTPDVRRACFQALKILEGIVYDTVFLEGNPFILPEVKTLLDGITVGGHKLLDERQVLNQARSWKTLLRYDSHDATEMMQFLVDCSTDDGLWIDAINPGQGDKNGYWC